ncbi:MAG: type II toxin-antitoxin system VapC family toxin [Alphaproteobacteria bacterium]|nr:type II toxin-antitoxin system VapC family toxin [Alphaproteobacteria bacterium]
MTAVLLDTHAWTWSLSSGSRLSSAALAGIAGAEVVLVSPISFFEISQKVRLGKWPEMVPFVGRLDAILSEQGGVPAAFTPEICLRAGMIDWDHRDPFDRLILATAQLMNVSLISADTVFDGRVTRIW